MLDALRRGANSWVLKPLLLLLVLAFIVWGVADVFTGFGRGSVATACGAPISADEYQRSYSLMIETMARRFGQRPSPDEARQRGLDRAVLEDLMNQTCLDQEIERLGLAMSQSALVSSIESDPGFAGLDGKFDRARLNGFLRETGFSERGYLAQRRKEELRQQLTQAMLKDMPVSETLAGYVHTWRQEKRTIQHFTIDATKAPAPPTVDDAKLKETYESNKRQFVTPEFRHLGVLSLSTEAVRGRLDIPESDLRQAYENDKDARTIPERRRVSQIPFPDAAAAQAAAQDIAGGKSFVEVAKARGATEKDIDLGLLARSQLIDPAIAEAAFKLEKDKVSAPVAGRFGTVLLLVTEIQPGRVRPFEEMKDSIRNRLSGSKVTAELRKLQDQIDDGRSAGKTLKEIAAEGGMAYQEYAAVNQAGLDPSGAKVLDGPDAAVFLRSGFAGQVGLESEPVDLSGGGYAWVDVLGVTAEKQKPLEEVKADVEKLWRAQEASKALTELARKLVERADKGEKLADLAKEVGSRLMTSKPFSRQDTEAGLPAAAVQRSFALALGQRASTLAADGSGRMVFRLVKIEKPNAPSKEEATAIQSQMRNALQTEALQVYIEALRQRGGVSINEQEFRRISGADQPR